MERNFIEERRALRQQLQQLQTDEIRSNAKATRDEKQKKMTPEELSAQASADDVTLTVFSSEAGKKYLTGLATRRPVMHDEIMEAMERAANARAKAEKGNT